MQCPSRTNDAMFNSVNVAIDSLRDPEVVEYNLAAAPGVVNATLNTKLVDMCESRGDALAVIDVKGGFVPPEQSTDSATARRGSVDSVVNELKTNVINSSYGAAYYPYVQIRDLNNGQVVTVPPLCLLSEPCLIVKRFPSCGLLQLDLLVAAYQAVEQACLSSA